VKVKVTIWQEDQRLFKEAGFNIRWQDNSLEIQAVNIDVILGYRQSCGYVVREVLSKEIVSV
jgi:hypothetical protein